MDLFNREIVGWSIKPRMTADIVTDALTMVPGVNYPERPGRHVAEVLRVWNEDVDVLAEAVSVPEHQDGSASEGPERIRESPMALDVVDQPQRSLEQHFPGAGRQRLHYAHKPCRCTASDLASFATLRHTALGATPSFAAASSTAITTSGTGASSSRWVRWAA